MAEHQRNVKVLVELEIHVPDAALDNPAGSIVNDATYERVGDLIHATFEAGDPYDEMNAILIVQSVDMIKGDHG